MSIQQAEHEIDGATLKGVLSGNLAGLNDDQQAKYYLATCESIGVNPHTRPFQFITLNGKLTLYATRDCTDQLRRRDHISTTIAVRSDDTGIYSVIARAQTPDGRTEESIGAVAIAGLKGADLADAMMKAETKAKRRVTLSICGLGWLDEIEALSIAEPLPGEQAPTRPTASRDEPAPAPVVQARAVKPAGVESIADSQTGLIIRMLSELQLGVADLDDVLGRRIAVDALTFDEARLVITALKDEARRRAMSSGDES